MRGAARLVLLLAVLAVASRAWSLPEQRDTQVAEERLPANRPQRRLVQTSTQTDQQRLLAQKYAITNWDEYAVAHNISGWVSDNSVPVCLWTGVTCNPEGRIEGLALQCPNCKIKALGTVAQNTSQILPLKTLNLQQQKLSGKLPPEFGLNGAFPNLLNLLLQQNQLTGTIPETWNLPGTFPSLTLFTLHFNNLTGPLPEPDFWPQLQVMRLQNNALNGTLPGSWGKSLPNVQILSLHKNKLQGPLPDQWAAPTAFQMLEELYLQNNTLKGMLPQNTETRLQLPKLRILDLSFNSFPGGIPPGWGLNNSGPHLELVYLRGLGLNGSLPSEWGSGGGLQRLRQLWVDANDLSGTIPASWANLPQLEQLYVKPGNPRLCGPLPPGIKFKLCDASGNSECNVTAALDGPTCPPWNDPGDPLSVNSSTNTGAIVGGVIGGVAGGMVIVAGVIWGLRWNRRRKQRMSPFIAEAEGQLPPSKDDLSNYNQVLEALEGGDDPDLDAKHKTLVGRMVDRLFKHRGPALKAAPEEPTSSPGSVEAAGGSAAAAAAAAAAAGGAIALVPQPSKQASSQADTAMNPLSPFLYNNDSVLMSGEITHSMALSAQQTAGSGGSGGRHSGDGYSERRDVFVVDGLPHLSDWEIQPEEIQYMKRADGSDWELGCGGFGKVYKALRNGAQPVAVKVLQSGPDTRYMALNEFRREVAILKACRDPNIVAFLGACMRDDCAMLVTEYCEGGNLARNIVAGKVSWYRRGRKIALDIAKGLVFLHSRRIVHLDLKSPNILLARDGTAKIADVGLAKIIAQEYSAVTGAVGTLAWSSPEMLLGARCTEKSDIYSYGVVLWEIATGNTPIRGQLRDVRVPEECPEELRKLMLDCLEQNPRRRPSAQQLVERLRKIPVSPQEHAPALPPPMLRPETASEAAALAKHRKSMNAAAAAVAARQAAGGAPRQASAEPAHQGAAAAAAPAEVSPFAALAAEPALATPRTASNASDAVAKPASGSTAGTPGQALAPGASLPSPFKQQSSAGTQLPTQWSSSDELAGSKDASRSASQAGQAGTGLSRNPSVPAPPGSSMRLPPGMPKPSPFAGARSGSFSPASPGSPPADKRPE